MRSDPKDQIEVLVRGVQGGVLSPNEVRGRERLPRVEFGDEPRVLQQVVPLRQPVFPRHRLRLQCPPQRRTRRPYNAIGAGPGCLERRISSRSSPIGNGAAAPGVIRKVKEDAGVRPTFVRKVKRNARIG
jgi:hypothetical protein